MRNYFRKAGRWLSLSWLLLSLTACGFHLRGDVPLPAAMKQTFISSNGRTPFYYELESVLLAAGAEVLESGEAATSTLIIHKETLSRRVLSVDTQGRASEYELRLRVVFSLVEQGGKVIADKEVFEVLRDYRFNPDNVLASGGQESVLQTEMQRYAAGQILRRLQSLSRSSQTSLPASEETESAPPAEAL